ARREASAGPTPDRARRAEDARRLGRVGGGGGAGPAKHPAPPRRLVVRRAVHEAALAVAPRQRPRQHELAVAPESGLGGLVHGRGDLDVVLAPLVTAGGVADAQPGEVELVRAVHTRIGDGCDRGAPLRQRHAHHRLQVRGGVGARAPRPASGADLDAGDALAVVAPCALEVMEVVLERALDHALAYRDRADPPPVGAVGITGTDGRRGAVAHALRFLPPG